jgi:hypothetical protein
MLARLQKLHIRENDAALSLDRLSSLRGFLIASGIGASSASFSLLLGLLLVEVVVPEKERAEHA